jgi:hypothetical protein
MLLFQNGGFTLVAGSATATGVLNSTATDPGGRIVGGRFTYNNRLYLFGGSRLYNVNDMWYFDGTQWVTVVRDKEG